MKIELQRTIDRVLGKVLCRAFSFLDWKRSPKPLNAAPSKILIILLSEMGSQVLTRPLFAFLKRQYPEARVFALVFKKNRECMSTLQLVSEERLMAVDGDAFLPMVFDSLRFILKMRREKIDAVVDCELFSRVSSLYAMLSGAGIRAGFHPHRQEGLYRGEFINRPVLYNPYCHVSRQFVHLAMALKNPSGFPLLKRKPDEDLFRVAQLPLNEGEKSALKTRLETDFPTIAGKKLILMYPGGGLLPIRAWPIENFCGVSQALISEGYGVGIIGMGEDKPLAEVIRAETASPGCVDLTGYTKTVKELIMLFHFASLLITNDGGPGHFAALTPISTIAFYGPETPLLYGPLDEKCVCLHEPLPCSPCLTAYNHRNSPCDGNNVCLKSISPQTVLHTAHMLLQKNSPKQGEKEPQ